MWTQPNSHHYVMIGRSVFCHKINGLSTGLKRRLPNLRVKCIIIIPIYLNIDCWCFLTCDLLMDRKFWHRNFIVGHGYSLQTCRILENLEGPIELWLSPTWREQLIFAGRLPLYVLDKSLKRYCIFVHKLAALSSRALLPCPSLEIHYCKQGTLPGAAWKQCWNTWQLFSQGGIACSCLFRICRLENEQIVCTW